MIEKSCATFTSTSPLISMRCRLFVRTARPGAIRLRRECLDRILSWPTADLKAKLLAFRDYFIGYRSHAGLQERPPKSVDERKGPVSLISDRWRKHCRCLYQTPIGA